MEPRPDTTSASGSTSDMPRLPAQGHSCLALSSSGCICSPWPSPPSGLYPSDVPRDFSLPALWSGLPWELTWAPIIRPPLVTVKRSQVPAHVSFTLQALSVWHPPFFSILEMQVLCSGVGNGTEAECRSHGLTGWISPKPAPYCTTGTLRLSAGKWTGCSHCAGLHSP